MRAGVAPEPREVYGQLPDVLADKIYAEDMLVDDWQWVLQQSDDLTVACFEDGRGGIAYLLKSTDTHDEVVVTRNSCEDETRTIDDPFVLSLLDYYEVTLVDMDAIQGNPHPIGAPWRDEETMRELWVEEDMSVAEMTEALDCSRPTVYRWLDNHGLRDRTENSPRAYDD